MDSEKNIEIIGNIQEFSSIYNDLATLMPNLIGSNLPEIIKELGFFSAKGFFKLHHNGSRNQSATDLQQR
ncbi:hypothetical protein CCAN11_2470021 [Capnocytophaga canimorsus]|uniref:Uncharacterized protein n=1 Tax=Capnocytophaga canimorsus TaxID=28188 RepID=A0A0B7IPG9_9FLAO|nr:hypothetical protein CCAN11_2470021 [Capnocytophaga canimorsus]